MFSIWPSNRRQAHDKSDASRLDRFEAGPVVPRAPTLKVLVVDRSDETREVLRTACESRGLAVWGAKRLDEGLRLLRVQQPDLIVLDVETASHASDEIRGAFCVGRPLHAPVVLLGTKKRIAQDFPCHVFVAKPYHYGPLIRKIEGLLDEARRPLTRIA